MNNRFLHSLKSFIMRSRFRLIIPVTAVLLALVLLLISTDCFFGVNTRSIRSFFGQGEFSWSADGYPLSVHYIDVGSGDSILICCEGRYALIDTGSNSLHGTAKRYLKSLGVEELELFIASHGDSDHIGDFSSIADSFRINNVLVSGYEDTGELTPAQKSFYEKTEEYSINTVTAAVSGFTLGSAKLRILSPKKKYKSSNNNSLVIRLEYKDSSFLFTGDMGSQAEEELLDSGEDISSDVLKISHHGSRYSTTQAFYDAVAPSYTVISASRYDDKHPDREVVSRIESSGAVILRTDIQGSIIIATDGTTIKTYTQKNTPL